jgi:hypothetical protein
MKNPRNAWISDPALRGFLFLACSGRGCKFLRPLNAGGSLHGDEERQNRADGDSESSEPIEEESVGKQNQVQELSGSCLKSRTPHPRHDSQIADQQEN